ncbi:hypothetical protein BJX61DRAFT_30246 [Aspergillus egyptiacus]|nr:hypothetical protein BJX61DRAFT_30246 [Aspergillus egyptiacus]
MLAAENMINRIVRGCDFHFFFIYIFFGYYISFNLSTKSQQNPSITTSSVMVEFSRVGGGRWALGTDAAESGSPGEKGDLSPSNILLLCFFADRLVLMTTYSADGPPHVRVLLLSHRHRHLILLLFQENGPCFLQIIIILLMLFCPVLILFN